MASVNPWNKTVNSGHAANVSGVAPRGGIDVRLGPTDPAAQKKASFGGMAANRSRLPDANCNTFIQFGDFSPVGSGGSQNFAAAQNLYPAGVSDVPTATFVENVNPGSSETLGAGGHPVPSRDKPLGNLEIKNGPTAARRPPAALGKNTVVGKSTASHSQALDEVRMTEEAELNKDSDPRSIPTFNTMNEEDFPGLGAAPSGKGRRRENRAPSKPVIGASKNSGADIAACVDASKLDARRGVGTSVGDVEAYRRHERREFNRGRGRDSGGEGRDIDALGRTLTKILRHQAEQLKLDLAKDGYTEVNQLLKLPMKTASLRPLSSHTVEDVLLAVERDNKQRFGIKKENGVLLIRANQGHSIKTVETEELLKPILSAEEIPVCVHGTYDEYLDSIARQGLKRMKRNHVHFASGLTPTDGVISGMRKTCNILIYLDVSKALQDGMKLYMSENGVILTEGFGGVVPPKYFKEIRSWPDQKPLKNLVLETSTNSD
ncbi:hypothetical protein R1flu_002705 [Riccia fluitans]|uniref:2'-phosphotransferase n=1 Tax=Riccia fluitans TaxID=41844 RepID=A0ABD1Y6X5_9MARC